MTQRLVALLMVIFSFRAGAQIPVLDMELIDSESGLAAVDSPDGVLIRLKGLGGMWVTILGHVSIAPYPGETSPASLDAFYATYPWVTKPVPTNLANLGMASNGIPVEMPFGLLAERWATLVAPNDAESWMAQPLLVASASGSLNTPSLSRDWNTSSPLWVAHPDTSPGSEQTLWKSCLLGSSSGPNHVDSNSTVFSTRNLADAFLVRQAGSVENYKQFLADQSSYMLSNQLTMYLSIQAIAVGSTSTFQAATTDNATGSFSPINYQDVFISVSAVRTVYVSLGVPATGVRDEGYILGGRSMNPVARSTFVKVPANGNWFPLPTMSLLAGGNTHTLTGQFAGVGFMQFNMPAGTTLSLGQTVTILGIQNAIGELSGFEPGSTDPIHWATLTVGL